MDRRSNNIFYLMGGAVALGILLQAAESAAHLQGLELRTFIQVGKGIYLWCALPILLLFSVHTLWKQALGGKWKALRGVVVYLGIAVIMAVGFCRGVTYLFTDEMIEETVLDNGDIEGRYSGFLEEGRVRYYRPVAGIFRKPFAAWSKEDLLERVRTQYQAEAELVENPPVALAEGTYLFRVPDRLEQGAYIYFHVCDSYWMPNNYCSQVMLSEAARFWQHRDRRVQILIDGSRTDISEWADSPERQAEPGESVSGHYLCVPCKDSEEDIKACAADMTDWYRFVRETAQLSWEQEEVREILGEVQLVNGQDMLLFSVRDDLLQEMMEEESWELVYGQMESMLLNVFAEHREEQARQEQEALQREEEAQQAEELQFIQHYQGDYAAECSLPDGSICYRMVVIDAAAGSRLYGLLRSLNGGSVWEIVSLDPFHQRSGMGMEFIFLNEELGFAALMQNGGDNAELFVTEDGGRNYTPVVMEGYVVTLDNGYTYEPFDYPEMPYEEDGVIYVQCGQGLDGDYDGGDAAGLALYRSVDGGHTFTFVEREQASGQSEE